jgi:hypothetical protein
VENLLRIAVFVLLVLIAAAVAAAQSWGGSEGSSIVRVSPVAIGSQYDRPGIFFLGRPAKVLPPAYAYVYPYGTARIEIGDGYVVREFQPLDSHGAATYSAQVYRQTAGRRAMALASNVPSEKGRSVISRLQSRG